MTTKSDSDIRIDVGDLQRPGLKMVTDWGWPFTCLADHPSDEGDIIARGTEHVTFSWDGSLRWHLRCYRPGLEDEFRGQLIVADFTGARLRALS